MAAPSSTNGPTDELERHRSAIARYIRKMVRDSTEADDLTQETFLRAFRERSTLKDDSALLSWLYQIATHVCLDCLRRRSRMQTRNDEQHSEDLEIEDKHAESPLAVVQRREMSDCVQRYVASLSDTYRAVLLLHDVDGLSAVEISELLGLPLTTVKMRLHRGRRKLEAMLHQACAFGLDDRGVLVCDPKQNH